MRRRRVLVQLRRKWSFISSNQSHPKNLAQIIYKWLYHHRKVPYLETNHCFLTIRKGQSKGRSYSNNDNQVHPAQDVRVQFKNGQTDTTKRDIMTNLVRETLSSLGTNWQVLLTFLLQNHSPCHTSLTLCSTITCDSLHGCQAWSIQERPLTHWWNINNRRMCVAEQICKTGCCIHE